MDKPTENNTVTDIKAYLDAQGISYATDARKADLLALIPSDEQEPAQPENEPTEAPVDSETQAEEDSTETEPPVRDKEVPNVQDTKFTKYEIIVLSSFDGPTRDLLRLALKDDQLYTISEALAAKTALAERMFD